MQFPALNIPENGKLADNITWFARALRVAGLPVDTGRIIDAIRAVEAVGFTRKQDFFNVLQACFVSRPEHRLVFAQTFRLFWRDPKYLEHMIAALSPMIRGVQEERRAQPAEKRAAEALLDGMSRDSRKHEEDTEETEIEIDASHTMSGEERLRTLDFELMSSEEMAAAKRMLSKLALPAKPLISRRSKPHPHGILNDGPATLRKALRHGGEVHKFSLKTRRKNWPNLVTLCDVSGSMSQYSRAVLHFLHAVSNERAAGWAKVHAFTFGTQLTNITRHLATRDVDAALAAAGVQAQDWQGGTKIGTCLHRFNRDWSRRVMGAGAVVLLITDGLDRDDPAVLEREMRRLQRSAKKVIWLNPLLRWDAFAPKAEGIKAMLPHVDSFRAGHNIAALEALAEAISRPDDKGEKTRLMEQISRKERVAPARSWSA
ncbi:VWA domain-containing protein [uncultured Litoreibacter sp.]|uniref:vWA domain-containing protein n=1 Tax=uncultured Litoreibacter sp. TaxID=1392394 RepID=UPI002606F143|nr:VWA domain-containing protein [uncultured Litoreibacter sp.]